MLRYTYIASLVQLLELPFQMQVLSACYCELSVIAKNREEVIAA